jgi:hypothetical protein
LRPSQKKKNIVELHEAAARAGYAPVLEVSTKSEEKVGQYPQFGFSVDRNGDVTRTTTNMRHTTSRIARF